MARSRPLLPAAAESSSPARQEHQDLAAKLGSVKNQVEPPNAADPETEQPFGSVRFIRSVLADTERHEAIRKRFVDSHPLPTFTRERIAAIIEEHVREEEQKHT